MKKIEIRDHLHTFNKYAFEGDMVEVVKIFNFKSWWKKNMASHKPAIDISKYNKFVINTDINYGWDNDESTEFKVYGWRWETDEEYEKRELAAKVRKEAAERGAKTRKLANQKREKTLYETLKKKFEK